MPTDDDDHEIDDRFTDAEISERLVMSADALELLPRNFDARLNAIEYAGWLMRQAAMRLDLLGK